MQYHDAGAFVADVRLIFENAKKYNPPKHPIHVAATKLSKVRNCYRVLVLWPICCHVKNRTFTEEKKTGILCCL